MTCSSCGYAMGPFDKECARCQKNPQRHPAAPLLTNNSQPGQANNSQANQSQSVHSQAAHAEANRSQAVRPAPTSPPTLPASMMQCPACGNPMSRTTRACPHCGENFEPPTEKKVLHVVLILWAILNTLGCLTGLFNEATLFATNPYLNPSGGNGSNGVLGIAIAVFLVAYACLWWMIARNYGRKIQRRR